VPFWVAHVAAHLEGGSITSRIVSKAGRRHARFAGPAAGPGLLVAAARRLAAGPGPPAADGAAQRLAWLPRAVRGRSGGGRGARSRACQRYEDSDPAVRQFGECDGNAYLARAYPDFDALWADGEFAPLGAGAAEADERRGRPGVGEGGGMTLPSLLEPLASRCAAAG
jgi:exodeoxyribonuclease V gamma subunit